MRPLLLTSRACFLSVRRHQLLVTDYINRTETRHTARHLPFDAVITYRAGGSVSFEATRFLASQGVPVIHLNWDGCETATTLPARPVSGKLRLAQYQTSLDRRRSGTIAMALVREKVAKSIALLTFLRRRYPVIDLSRVESVKEGRWPMGFELKVAEAYWPEYAKVIRSSQPRFDFPSRKSGSNNMGATDPVNSLLNYGYGVLEARVRLALQKTGLDPDVGFLHSSMPGATPLVYDVMELFRWVVDLAVVELVESRQIEVEDFETRSDYKVSLKARAAHRLVQRISENLNRTTLVESRNLKYETLLELRVRELAKFLVRESDTLLLATPFSVDESKAGADLTSRLLAMSVDERKRLGISKTTHFYIRRNLNEGKPIRIYASTRRKLLLG